MPVLPPVYSTMKSPGLNRPSSSALEIIACAVRSFMLPVGFSHSSFAKTCAQPGGTTLCNCTNEVFPIACRMLIPILILSFSSTQSLQTFFSQTLGFTHECLEIVFAAAMVRNRDAQRIFALQHRRGGHGDATLVQFHEQFAIQLIVCGFIKAFGGKTKADDVQRNRREQLE